MSLDAVWADLNNIYRMVWDHRPFFNAQLNDADVQRWCLSTGLSRTRLYNEIAIYLARGFHNGRLGFTFCDAVVNDLAGNLFRDNHDLPELFWDVFLAFDSGEFYPNNDRATSPVDVYTKPLIARFLKTMDVRSPDKAFPWTHVQK